MKSLSFKKDLIGVQEELLRFAYKLTANREEANDLLQETSLKALDNEDKYIPDTNFKGWMYTIMRNIFINNYRKIVRDQTFVDQTDNLYHLNLPQDLKVPRELMISKRCAALLMHCPRNIKYLFLCMFQDLNIVRLLRSLIYH